MGNIIPIRNNLVGQKIQTKRWYWIHQKNGNKEVWYLLQKFNLRATGEEYLRVKHQDGFLAHIPGDSVLEIQLYR